MPAEIVFTSVPRGLDGGSGTQPVRRTKDMNPSLSERLKIISGYSHPYRQGDSRNPVVYFHRIERMAGGTHHVLARMCDAGSDHTGRSNYLGHLLAVESSAVGAKQAGPAAVALEGFTFLANWSGSPEERDPPTIIGCKQADPGPCGAWVAAGLDPGIAGDLAEAAMKGEEVCLITPTSQPDPEFVLRLFADALRLVQPAARWKVTFNTCEIEPFDATWRAIRADLPQARDMRERGGRLIDLTAGARGSDGPYAAFARGEAATLPWQPKVSGDKQGSKESSIRDGGVQEGIGRSGTGDGRTDLSDRPIGRKSAGRRQGATAGAERKRRFPVQETPAPLLQRIPWPVYLAIPVALLFLIAGTVGVLRPELFGFQPSEGTVPAGPRDDEIAKDEQKDLNAKRDEREKLEDEAIKLKQDLKKPADGRTAAKIQDDAKKLSDEIERARRGPPSLQIKRGTSDDPDTLVEQVFDQCKFVEPWCDHDEDSVPVDKKSLEDLKRTVEKLKEAEATRKKADQELSEARRRFEDLRDRELEMRTAEESREKKKKASEQQEKAYATLAKLATHAILPSPQGTDIDDSSTRNVPIELGEFPVAHLIDPTFALAVPRDEYLGRPFVAQVSRPDAAKNEWLIEFKPHAMEGELEAGSNGPRPLAKLTVDNDRLFIALTDPPSNNRPQSLLRRCVLLVSAAKPSAKETATSEGSAAKRDKPHVIRFVKPTKVGSLRVDPFVATPKKLDIPLPPGIASLANGTTLKLPVASCEVKARFVGQRVDMRLPAAEAPGGMMKKRLSLAQLGDGVQLVLDVAMTLADATLTVRPELTGPNANKFPQLDVIKEKFLDEPEKQRDRVKKAWEERVLKNEGMKPGAPAGLNEQKLRAWFDEPFAVQAKMNVVIKGHETIQKSLDEFLRHEYRQAEEELNRRRDAGEKNVPDRPREPASFDEWVRRDLLDDPDPGNWQKNFQATVTRWWKWFVPKLESEWKNISGYVVAVLKETEKSDCRIEAIMSLAYDKDGNEYAVPLVEFGESPQSSASGPFQGLE